MNVRTYKDPQAIGTAAAALFSAKVIENPHAVLGLATGADKAEAVKAMITGPVTPQCPASILQLHPNVTIMLDAPAASLL